MHVLSGSTPGFYVYRITLTLVLRCYLKFFNIDLIFQLLGRTTLLSFATLLE